MNEIEIVNNIGHVMLIEILKVKEQLKYLFDKSLKNANVEKEQLFIYNSLVRINKLFKK